MLIKTLSRRGPEHDPDVIEDYRSLYEGGQRFRKRAKRFITQNPSEPTKLYEQRVREAHYRSYIGTVVDYFTALLFSTPLIYKATRGESKAEIDHPDWFSSFCADADGTGTDFIEFLRLRASDSMVARSGFWMLDFPEMYGKAASKAEAEQNGALEIAIREVPAECVLDVGRDKRGKLTWAIVHTVTNPRESFEEDRTFDVHTWTVLTKEFVREYSVKVEAGAQPDENKEATLVQEHSHDLGEVPLIELNVGKGLWIANRLESPQLEHFRLSSANNWSIRRTCYAMPVLSLKDPKGFQERQNTMGAGYYLTLGLDEKLEFAAPPVQHIADTREEVRSIKDEIFRLVTQMSLGIENNAAAIGRSAESKVVDADSLQVTLRTYGGLVRDSIRRTLNLVSLARGEEISWEVEGLDKFDTLAPDVLLELLETALTIGIPSETFQTEAKYRAAAALLPGAENSMKETIRAEIAESVKKQGVEPPKPSGSPKEPPETGEEPGEETEA